MNQQETQPSYEEIERGMELMQAMEYEKALFLCISAFERGNFEQMSAILEQAQTDPVLEKMIEETHEVYASEMPEPTPEAKAKMDALIAGLMANVKGK